MIQHHAEQTEIPLFAPTFAIDECLEEIRQCLEHGWTGIGYKTIEFEQEFAAYIGKPYCHFVNSNTNGLHLLLEMLKRENNWPVDAEVISSPMTFISTNHSIHHAGLKPVFADIDESLCVNVCEVRKKITSRTKAVIFVSLGGNSGELEEIKKLCDLNNIILIHDAAHSAGSRLNGKHLSSYVDYSVYSFQAVKNLPTADSGMVVVSSEREDSLIRKLSWCGIDKDTFARSQGAYKWKYEVNDYGFKYHGNSIVASIGKVQLRYLDVDNLHRRKLAALYQKHLAHIENLKYIRHANERESSRHLVQFYAAKRDDLIRFLANRKVGAGVHYVPSNLYPIYSDQKTDNAEHLSSQIISLPLHMKMSEIDVLRISELIADFYSDAK